jgi:hypothetical protein
MFHPGDSVTQDIFHEISERYDQMSAPMSDTMFRSITWRDRASLFFHSLYPLDLSRLLPAGTDCPHKWTGICSRHGQWNIGPCSTSAMFHVLCLTKEEIYDET